MSIRPCRARSSFRVVAVGLALAGVASAEPPPLEHFFAAPELTRFRISPDGTRAFSVSPKDGEWRLAVVDLGRMKSIASIRADKRPIFGAWWVNDERILLSVSYANGRVARLASADAKGQSVRDFGKRRNSGQSSSPEAFELLHLLPDSKDEVLVTEFTRWRGTLALSGSEPTQLVRRMNVRTGASHVVLARVQALGWWPDPDGTLRFRRNKLTGDAQFSYSPDGKQWDDIGAFGDRSLDLSRFLPLGFDTATSDPVVTSRHAGDRFALYRYGAGETRFSAPLFEDAEIDVAGRPALTRTGRLRGVHYHDDGWKTHWLDPAWQTRAAKLEHALPDANVRIVDWDDAESRFILVAEGERRPPVYLLYTEADPPRIEPLASLYPELDNEQLVSSRPVRYPARDGRPIRGYLTLPERVEGELPPLIVRVHDGPWTATGGILAPGGHAKIEFDPEIQFFVSRGWAVFRPDYRGSTGYGLEHERAGWGRWGLEMQDDLEDGVRALIAQGVVDPKRVCIFGHGYGGYAALEGAAKTPDLYRCAAAYNGVFDLPGFLSDAQWYVDEAEIERRIGAPHEQLVRVSPARHAERIQAPILLAFGKERGPAWIWTDDQFDAMRDGLKAAEKPFTEVRLKHDGEGLGREENRLVFYRALERFFREHLGTRD